MKLTIVRHGETEENINDTVQGQIPGQLTKKGYHQIELLGERLKDEHFDIVFCSDLLRTTETAKGIMKFHPDTEIIYTKEIREMDCGVLEGLPLQELRDQRAASGESIIEWRIGGAESHVMLRKRALNFFENLFPKFKGKSVLLITHGGFIQHLVGFFRGQDTLESKKTFYKNTCVNIFEIEDINSHKAILIDSADHLE